MLSYRVYLQSVEWVWLLWLVSIVVVLCMTRTALRRLNATGLRRLWRSEEGAAYSLAYALTVPIYVMFVSLIVEMTGILLVKMGTVHAAYAAARCHIVYSSLVAADDAQARTERAAARAMVPFASGSWLHADGAQDARAVADANSYCDAAQKYDAQLPAQRFFLTRKYHYAARAIRMEVRKLSPEPNGLVEATLHYKVPVYIPGVGRVLGGQSSPWGGNYYVLDIATTIELPDEAPEPPAPGETPNRPSGPLGITYEVPND